MYLQVNRLFGFSSSLSFWKRNHRNFPKKPVHSFLSSKHYQMLRSGWGTSGQLIPEWRSGMLKSTSPMSRAGASLRFYILKSNLLKSECWKAFKGCIISFPFSCTFLSMVGLEVLSSAFHSFLRSIVSY